MNLLHDIDHGDALKMTVIIEIPKHSHNKYEIDKKTGLISLDRVLSSAQTFPFDYGFVPRTLWHDGDPLDVIVLTTSPLFPGILVRVRPVAIMHMNDSGYDDAKIISVPADDPRWAHVKDLKNVNKHTIKEIEHFYVTYKQLQGKKVVVSRFEGKAGAEKAFKESVVLYKKSRGKKKK